MIPVTKPLRRTDSVAVSDSVRLANCLAGVPSR